MKGMEQLRKASLIKKIVDCNDLNVPCKAS